MKRRVFCGLVAGATALTRHPAAAAPNPEYATKLIDTIGTSCVVEQPSAQSVNQDNGPIGVAVPFSVAASTAAQSSLVRLAEFRIGLHHTKWYPAGLAGYGGLWLSIVEDVNDGPNGPRRWESRFIVQSGPTLLKNSFPQGARAVSLSAGKKYWFVAQGYANIAQSVYKNCDFDWLRGPLNKMGTYKLRALGDQMWFPSPAGVTLPALAIIGYRRDLLCSSAVLCG